MYIRFSKESDREEIKDLLMKCFGDHNESCTLNNLNGRYLLAFDDSEMNGGNLLAMTGLIWVNEYHGYEIDWTCTHPKYQGKGIMHELFKRVCDLTDENIYCSCWQLWYKEDVNLHSLMKDFGFEEVIRNRVTWDSRYNCKAGASGCCVEQASPWCRCYEDLYLRKKKVPNPVANKSNV